VEAPTAKDFFFSTECFDVRAWEERERAFFHSIRTRNGTNKTTYSHRLDTVNEIVNTLLPPHRPLEIMDVAVSSGVGTLEWMESLERAGIEYRMTAGDLYVRAFLLSFSRFLNILVDDTGYPLQFDFRGKAVPYPVGRRRSLLFPPLFIFAVICRWALPVLLASFFRRWAGKGEGDSTYRFGVGCHRILLISPRVSTRQSLKIVEDDILAPATFDNGFHVVRAANILNRLYFNERTLRTMAVNLRARLAKHGILVVCRTDPHRVNHGTVFRLNAANQFEVIGRIGQGSETEHLILRLPPADDARAPVAT
jgi:hypothetical protein